MKKVRQEMVETIAETIAKTIAKTEKMKNLFALTTIAICSAASLWPVQQASGFQSGARTTPDSFPASRSATGSLEQPIDTQPTSFSQPQFTDPFGPVVVQTDQAGGEAPEVFGSPAVRSQGNLWSIHNPTSQRLFDHSIWDCFLDKYVVTDCDGLNRVRYQNVTPQDRRALQSYLQQLQSADVQTLNRGQQLAFWLNFYNAQTVQTILNHYPVRSIRQIKTNLLDVVGPFNDDVVTVLGQRLSLSAIENDIIRANWKDPRIHYALNCASYGCPNLKRTAWQSWNLDADLTQAAYEFINSGRAVKTGPLGLNVSASKIYKWYKDDFGGSEKAILAHLRQYAAPPLLNRLNGRRRIAYHFYDWSLNDARIMRSPLAESLIR